MKSGLILSALLLLVQSVADAQQVQILLDYSFNLSYSVTDDSFVQFELNFDPSVLSPVSNASWYASVGLNSQPLMSGSNMVICAGSGIANSYVTAYRRPSLVDSSNELIGVWNASISFTNSIYTCRFNRNNTANNSNYFQLDPKSSVYLVWAYGAYDLTSKLIKRHTERGVYYVDRLASTTTTTTTSTTTTTTEAPTSTTTFTSTTTQSTTTSQQTTTTTQTTTQPTTTTSSLPPPISLSSLSVDLFNISWIYNPVYTTFTIQYPYESTPKNAYIAFSFSNDQMMGADNVLSCITLSNKSDVYNMWATGHRRPSLLVSNDSKIGLSNISIAYVNGSLVCTFDRINSMPNVTNYADLNMNSYFILVAEGSTFSSGLMLTHDSRFYSQFMINFKLVTNQTGGAVSLTKVKAHGCMMVISWIVLAPNAILFARYFKFIFPSVKPCNIQFWFHIHRPFMMCVTLASLAAFITILWDNKWSWVDYEIDMIEFIHSIFGICTIGFSVIQMILGTLRPDKDHPRRCVFNHVHRTLGISTFILSVVSVFLGISLRRVNLDAKLGYAMIAWCSWLVILPLCLESFKILSRNVQIGEEKNAQAAVLPEVNNRINPVKMFLLLVHIILATSFGATLVYFIVKIN